LIILVLWCIDIVRFAQSWGIKDILDKLLNPGGETIPPVAEIGQADIVFVIDTTGSMGSVINNVKTILQTLPTH